MDQIAQHVKELEDSWKRAFTDLQSNPASLEEAAKKASSHADASAQAREN
jgi:hypothetical protein